MTSKFKRESVYFDTGFEAEAELCRHIEKTPGLLRAFVRAGFAQECKEEESTQERKPEGTQGDGNE